MEKYILNSMYFHGNIQFLYVFRWKYVIEMNVSFHEFNIYFDVYFDGNKYIEFNIFFQ